ncbi:MAG: thymidylate synthase [Muribaculaceae bacterium]|nr:thymidylate synthase [Muribaculaceae bacterium]
MAYLIKGRTANNLYYQARKKIDSEGENSSNTNELLHVVLELEDPLQKWVSWRKPAMSISFALAELIWILVGDNKRDLIDFWNPAYERYASDEDSNYYHGAYGYRLAKNFGFNQLHRAYEALKSRPNNRQTVLLYWDPVKDMPNENGTSTSHDIPCNICSLLKIRNEKLEWAQIMRSNDVFRGLPYNLVQFTSIQEILAGWLNIGLGKYTHFSDSLHLYLSDKDTGIKRSTYIVNNDSLSIPKFESDLIIADIYSRMKVMLNANLTSEQLFNASTLRSQYESYNNIMSIIGAYVANKLNYKDILKSLLTQCTNKLYIKMWQNFMIK